MECDVHYLEYYDGDVSNLTERFCGLMQGGLPTSRNSVVILKSSEERHLNNEMKIRYQAVNKNFSDTGIFQTLYDNYFCISFKFSLCFGIGETGSVLRDVHCILWSRVYGPFINMDWL